MSRAAWLEQRLRESPAPLRTRLEAALAGLEEVDDLAEGLLAAACRTLQDVIGRGGEREAAFDLLVADGLLTLACEAVALSDPERLEERCRAMGPSGELGRLTERWARRS